MQIACLTLAATVALIAAGIPAAGAADADRGRFLYEARCTGCHGQSVHDREKRVATDYESVRTWVRRWSANLGLAWDGGEVEDVAFHLNSRYYRFPCPASVCRATGMHGEAGGALASAAPGARATAP